jgi:hypothetical protein
MLQLTSSSFANVHNLPRNATVGTLTIYSALGEKDQDEGRAGTYVIGYFLNEKDAIEAAKGTGVFGAKGYVNSTVANVVMYPDDDTDEFVIQIISSEVQTSFQSTKEIKEIALAKLTEKEKQILGLV